MAKLNFKVPAADTDTPLAVARMFASAGIKVFPCRECDQEGVDINTGDYVTWPEKSPYTSNGLNAATVTPRIVDIFFGDRYPTALIGTPTGEAMGAWVLDIDKHGDRDGHTWLAEMEALHGPLPETARATTANGGTHIFFKHVDGVRNRAAIAPGIDTRGTGGYICAPGSVMADGRAYRWVDADGKAYQPVDIPDFADAPEWLLKLVLPQDQPARPAHEYTPSGYTPQGNEPYVERAVQNEMEKVARAGEGNRGQQLYSSACALGEFVAAGAISRSEAESQLYQAALACGVAQKDGERSTMSRIKRGLDKTANKPREIPERTVGNDSTPVDPDAVRRMVEKTLARQNAAQEQPASSPSEELPPHEPKKRERFEKTWFDNIREGEPKVTFIKGVLGEREFTTISGLPGTGKSVIVTDMACHVAAGRDWHGRRVRQGLVIYVAAERKKLTERRMMAFRKEYGVEDVPLLVIGGRLDFTKDLKDARELIAEIKNAETETGLECVWIIIDTLTRVFGAGDQNASKDMSRFVQSCDEILAETKAHVTAIHHSAWSGERGKGAIDLDGAVDASFMVKKSHGAYKLICDGTNDGEEGDILSFTMKSVELGIDEDGEPTTAPVVVKTDGVSSSNKLVDSANGHNARALELLKGLLETDGLTPEGVHFPEGVLVVTEESWRQAVYADGKEGTPQPTLTQRFSRAFKALKKDKKIDKIGEWVFLT